jgi:protein SCO1/2
MLLMTVCLLSAAASELPQPLLPKDSLYQLDVALSDQDGKTFTLATRRGRPQLIAMFYTTCKFVCPLIVDSAKAIEHVLSSEQRTRLGILLISMDPARDDSAALKQVFDKRKLDARTWTLARIDEHHVRTLAALLGVRYRALADGEFNHTSSLVLLDENGRRVVSTNVLGAKPDPEFVAKLRELLRDLDTIESRSIAR